MALFSSLLAWFFRIVLVFGFWASWGVFAGPTLRAQVVVLQTEETVAASVVINEIHYDPDRKTEPVEFIELYNPTAASIDLSYWTLEGAVQFFFAPGTTLAANSCVVIGEDPVALQQKFDVAALGPFIGNLRRAGEEIILRDQNAKVADRVAYEQRFPWPVVGDAPGRAIELIHPALDNSHPSNWRAGGPTPGQPNHRLVDNPPPAIAAVGHTPHAPTAEDTVVITATVTDDDGVADVQLLYQLVAPGGYIALTDPAYATQWRSIPMQPINDNDYDYTVTMPDEVRRHRHLVRYRIQATDRGGRVISVPYPDDPQPNFAYFVYDGAPPWQGAVEPGAPGERGQMLTYDFNQMRPLPIYHFLTSRAALEDALFLPPAQRASGYMGDDYLWHGTLVAHGQVYDHVGFRARGGIYRYSVGKRMVKFNFHRSQRLQVYDDVGQPANELWDKLNLSPVIQHATRGYRGEQGMFESLGFRLFALAGVPASQTHFVHFRVIADAVEVGPAQYSGDFGGLYLAIEEVDGPFLDARGLPDGNLYKMENWTGELNNLGSAGPTDKSDLNAFISAYQTNPDAAWWRANFDLATYYSYRAILEAIHHYDLDQGKNYIYFRDPTNGRWSVYPWDLDLTWADTMFGEGAEPFRDRVLTHPEFQIDYQNRLREIRDLLFNPEQMNPLLAEHAARINTPADGLAMVDADRARWDYDPLFDNARYVDPKRSGHGHFYRLPPTQDFPGMVQIMRDWVVQRSQWIDQHLLTDRLLPATPRLVYSGPPGFPADQLTVQTTAFGDAQGAFAALQWRVAEVNWPGLRSYDASRPNRYEIESSWQSAILTSFNPTLTLPPGACQPGCVCRVRVRMQNTLGRWSHWSPPLEFVAGAPAHPPIRTLKISELMYHPSRHGYVPDSEFEFVELKNVGTATLALTNLRFTEGIDYAFPPGSQLAPSETLVLAKNVRWFTFRYGFVPSGEYDKRLDNTHDQVTLVDGFGRTVFTMAYYDGPPWPVLADGLGHSLVLNNPTETLDPNNGANWRASRFPGGSPGGEEPLAVVINEVLTRPAPGQAAAIELYNPEAFTADISGWQLRTEETGPALYTFPPGTLIPADGYWVRTVDQLGTPALLNPLGGELHLMATFRSGKASGYRHSVFYGGAPVGAAFGRYITGAGDERFPPQQSVTLGQPNAGPTVGPVVISEVAQLPGNGLEFIELTNLSDQPVPLYNPQEPGQTWRLSGVLYTFPAGVIIPAQGKVVITSVDPAAICTTYTVAHGVRVLGPIPLALADDAQSVALERPDTPDPAGRVPYVVVDDLAYEDRAPWPRRDSDGLLLERLQLTAYGNDPLNWRKGTRTNDLIQPATAGPGVALCSFEAFRTADKTVMIQWVTAQESNVQGFHLWRSVDGSREHAIPLTSTLLVTQAPQLAGAAYHFVDQTADPTRPATYWLQAVGSDNSVVDLLFTTTHTTLTQLHLPVIKR